MTSRPTWCNIYHSKSTTTWKPPDVSWHELRTGRTKHLQNSLVTLHSRSTVGSSWNAKCVFFTCHKQKKTGHIHVVNITNLVLRNVPLHRLGTNLTLVLPSLLVVSLPTPQSTLTITFANPFSDSPSTALATFLLFCYCPVGISQSILPDRTRECTAEGPHFDPQRSQISHPGLSD